jgi:hypothetical protein
MYRNMILYTVRIELKNNLKNYEYSSFVTVWTGRFFLTK